MAMTPSPLTRNVHNMCANYPQTRSFFCCCCDLLERPLWFSNSSTRFCSVRSLRTSCAQHARAALARFWGVSATYPFGKSSFSKIGARVSFGSLKCQLMKRFDSLCKVVDCFKDDIWCRHNDYLYVLFVHDVVDGVDSSTFVLFSVTVVATETGWFCLRFDFR